MFTDEYKTIEARAESSISDRGCRFVAVIAPVDSMKKAGEFISSLQHEHSEALDLVYAIRLGLEADRIVHAEGSDRTGPVIMAVLESAEITNAVIAVLREPEGQAPKDASDQAYRDAAANALRHAKIVTRILYDTVKFQISRNDLETVSRLVTDQRGKIITTSNESDLTISVKIRKIQSEALKKILTDATHGRTKVL